ncbi:MAG: Ig-like domain-containing protein [Candidatus Aenigmatarchaeota archaeon]
MAKRKNSGAKTALTALVASLIVIGIGYFAATAYVVSQFPIQYPGFGGQQIIVLPPSDTVAPTWSNMAQSANSVGAGQTITLSAYFTDDKSMANGQLFITADTNNWPVTAEAIAQASSISGTIAAGQSLAQQLDGKVISVSSISGGLRPSALVSVGSETYSFEAGEMKIMEGLLVKVSSINTIANPMTVTLEVGKKVSFDYSVPSIYFSGTTLYWRIKGSDSVGNTNTTDVLSFTIMDTNAPQCALKSDKTEAQTGSKIFLTATCIDENGPIKIRFYDDYTKKETAEQTAASGASVNYTFDTTGAPSGTVIKFAAVAEDSLGNRGYSEEISVTIFAIDTSDKESPVIVSADYQPLTIREGDEVTITVQATDNKDLASATFTIDAKEAGSKSMSGTSGTATFTWSATEGSHVWRVKVTDKAGNSADSLPLTFEVEPQPVLVLQCDPTGKPAPTEWSDCVNGKQTRIVYNCDTTKGTWTVATSEEQPCMAPTGTAALLLPIAAIMAVVIATAAAVVMMKKNAKKSAPATEAPKPSA